MKKNKKATVDTDTKLSSVFSPDDALRLKLAVATRGIGKKEKSSIYANLIKQQINRDIK